MRALIILGALLVIAGLFMFALPVLTTTDYDVIQSGAGAVSRTTVDIFVPSWAGAAAVAVGLILLLIGIAGRPRHY